MKKLLFSTITFLLLFSPLSAEEKCKSLLSKFKTLIAILLVKVQKN